MQRYKITLHSVDGEKKDQEHDNKDDALGVINAIGCFKAKNSVGKDIYVPFKKCNVIYLTIEPIDEGEGTPSYYVDEHGPAGYTEWMIDTHGAYGLEHMDYDEAVYFFESKLKDLKSLK